MHLNKIRLIVSVIVALLSCIVIKADDIIVMKNGDIIKSKVLEITQTEIKYKKISNIGGPTYTINSSEVLSITYSNGETEKFGESVSGTMNNSGPQFVERKTDSIRNQKLIDSYKQPHDFYEGKKPSNKITDKGTAFFAFTKNSVLSNEDIEICFYPHVQNHFYPSGDCLKEAIDKYGCYYEIVLLNKTSHPVYIDCSNSYIMDVDGAFRTFYDNRTFTENHGGSKGVFFNLGGITNSIGVGGVLGTLANSTTIGASSMSGVNVTHSDERIILLPPNGKVSLPTRKYMGKSKIFERYEYFPRPSYYNVTMQKWQPQYFEEGELPSYLKFCITYSDSPTFNIFSTLNCELYCYEIIGQLFDYYPSDKLHNGNGNVIFKRMDDGRPLFAPIYDQTFGKPKY